MPTDEVYRHSKWNTLTFYYKHNVFIGEAPSALSAVSTYFTGQYTDFYRKWRTTFNLRNLILAHSLSSHFPRNYHDFKCFFFKLFCVWNAVVNYLPVTNVKYIVSNFIFFFYYISIL